MNGSPRFKLFLNDIWPIAKETFDKCAAFIVASVVLALASPEVGAAVSTHFGATIGFVFVSLVGYVASKRAVKDNSKEQ